MTHHESPETGFDEFQEYLNSPGYRQRKEWEKFRAFFANHTVFRIFMAIIVGTVAFFYPLVYLIDEWGYEGGLNALFLWFFAPVLSYLIAFFSIPVHAVLREIGPFRRFWTWLGSKALLLSLIPFVLMYFSAELGLQYETKSRYRPEKRVMTMTPGMPELLMVFAIYPIVNFTWKRGPS